MAGLACGKFILGDSGGNPAAVALSGDITVSNTGVSAIGSSKVLNAMIADDAVDADKLAVNAVVFASVDNAAYETTLVGSNSKFARADAIKTYVDNQVAGLDVKASVVVATTAALSPSATYNNGAGTLTANSAGALVIDGETLTVQHARILVKNQADGHENGVYTLSTVGTGGAAYVLTRAADFDAASEFNGAPFFMVDGGSDNGAHGFVCSNSATVTLGDTDIEFYQFSAPGQDSVAGAGLAMTGNVLSVGVDDSSIELHNDELRLKDDGVTRAHMAHFSNAGSIIYGGSGGVVSDLALGTQNHVLIAGAAAPAYGLLADANIDGSAAISISKLAESEISGHALGTNLDALTAAANAGCKLSGSYDGQTARTVAVDFKVMKAGSTFGSTNANGDGIKTAAVSNMAGSAITGEALLNSAHPLFSMLGLYRNGVLHQGMRKTTAVANGDSAGTWRVYVDSGALKIEMREASSGTEYASDVFQLMLCLDNS